MRRFTGPFALAIIVTLANAAKPVVVDDTAYLAYARHIAQHPLDPYGFTIHWYTFPEPAMDVLAPPVLPYWLALGIGLFGEHIFLLKLWLFPFLWCFTYSLDVLLRRFARGTERFALPLIVLSPAVLPTVNLMLDIPAAALGLAALAMFMAACDRDDWKRAMLAGLIAGLAMQTKYTGLVATAAILWYGFLTRRKIRPTIVAGAVAAMIFVAWEGLLLLKYGESHFLHHLAEQREASGSLWHWWGEKLDLLPGLAGHLGCLGIAIALLAAHSLGLSNRRTVIVAVFWSLFVALVLLTPGVAIRARNVWRPVGTFALIAALSCAYVLWVHRKPLRLRPPKFVIGWVLLELAGYFALTPFPAARRVIGYTIASGVLVARLASRRQRIDSARAPPRWLLAFGISIGLLVAALDTLDAYPEKVLAERAAEQLRGEKRVWFAGHWGFQYYCESAGFTMLIPGQTVVQPGECLVLPLHPNDDQFHRPHIGLVPLAPPADSVELLRVLEWDDWLTARTIPNFYGGNDPIEGHRGPRLRVGLYRFTKPWAVPGR